MNSKRGQTQLSGSGGMATQSQITWPVTRWITAAAGCKQTLGPSRECKSLRVALWCIPTEWPDECSAEVGSSLEGSWAYRIVARGGTFLETPVPSFLAESIALDEASSFLSKYVNQNLLEPFEKHHRIVQFLLSSYNCQLTCTVS